MGQFSAGSETILTRQSKNLVGNIILIGGLSMLAAALILSWLNSRFITPANRPAPQLSNPRNANTAKPETNIRDTEALTEFYGNATSFVNVLRADCLAENGFPQAREARTLTRPPAVTSHPVAYGFRRVDFGPDTPETAKYYGFGGLEVAQANEEVGSIESQSKGFDAAASRCERWITERSPNLSTAIAQASKLRDEIRNSYSTEISKRSRGDLVKLSTCIQRRFPDIDGNSLYESLMTTTISF